jgi:hypothetical protein
MLAVVGLAAAAAAAAAGPQLPCCFSARQLALMRQLPLRLLLPGACDCDPEHFQGTLLQIGWDVTGAGGEGGMHALRVSTGE